MSLSVPLPSEIDYVYGTVNGEVMLWQKIGGAFHTSVPRSGGTVFVIELDAYDKAGNGKHYTAVLTYGIELIFDRTEADARLGRPKGYYNASDLNRVGAAVRFLADLLYEYGYSADVPTRTDWVPGDTATAQEGVIYLGNVHELIRVFCVLPTTPPPPSTIRRLSWQGANAIERALSDIYHCMYLMTQSFTYCGELYCGEDF